MVSLSGSVGETDCSQGKVSTTHVNYFYIMYNYFFRKLKSVMISAHDRLSLKTKVEEMKYPTIF